MQEPGSTETHICSRVLWLKGLVNENKHTHKDTGTHICSYTCSVLLVKDCCLVMTSWSVTGKIGAMAKVFANVIMI